MNIDETLKKIDETLAEEPKTIEMTKPEFEAYVNDQIAKAKKEKEEEYKDAKKKGKAKKRLDHLRGVVEGVSKAMWEGTNGTQSIPVYNEPGLTNDKERTEKEVPLQNFSSMDNQAWAGAGGTVGFNKAIDDLAKEIDGLASGTAAPAAQGSANVDQDGQQNSGTFEWPSDIAGGEFAKEGVTKSAPLWGKDTDEVPAK